MSELAFTPAALFAGHRDGTTVIMPTVAEHDDRFDAAFLHYGGKPGWPVMQLPLVSKGVAVAIEQGIAGVEMNFGDRASRVMQKATQAVKEQTARSLQQQYLLASAEPAKNQFAIHAWLRIFSLRIWRCQ